MKTPNWLMPAFLSFGAIFIVIGLSGTYSLILLFSFVGALMLSLGLITLFVKVQHLEKEIKKLKPKNEQ